MTEQLSLNFLIAFGQELCQALSPPVQEEFIVPQDGYEVWIRAFDKPPGQSTVANLSDSEVQLVRAECERYFECSAIRCEHLLLAISRILARWPAEASGDATIS